MAQASLVRRSFRFVALVLLGLCLLLAALLVLFRFVNPPTSAFMIAHQISGSGQGVQQQWVSLEQISPWMPLAVVASEDQRFPDHWGLDVHAIESAVREFASGEGLRGASTITQQTAKNLFLWSGRSMVRKGLEAGLALGLEVAWSKRRIMEVYLNIAEFGRGIYGIEAASRAYFGIPARYLSPSQAARLAAVLPNPKVFSAAQPSAYVWQRAEWIQQQMRQLGGTGYLAFL
ncbi:MULTISPECIES: monofunctional biosynthetic peptidoglycan transglycosylase [Marinobacter]|uniref:Biosynthetic peptidoglycan transglycosylase n=1 Tax=Marinobacter profundi TaxID=2666256 RepID=A0A2G1UMB7_9GAMM|nr:MULTISPECIES: monofunctional biosynthetic peptidoglycan transglycosylase [Marinobacter]MBD3655119.1 monofunctional biosynthetic peptidoglycan transglycosylase [Marinobacter sp.]PHQ15560.1 monofunctional biosynthetic peptidoglycan transglycosylase [Marinobacter profundi]